MLNKQIYSGHLARLVHHEKPLDVLRRLRSVSGVEPLRDGKWYTFSWAPKYSVRNEYGDGVEATREQPCQFIVRQSSDRFMLLSTHGTIVEAFFRQARMSDLIEFPRIDIGAIVNHLSGTESADGREYRMGVLFGQLEGYGRALRTIGLWGDDIANAQFFYQIRHQISAYRVSIRDTRSDREVASVGSQGEVSFYYRGLIQLDQTDRLMKFLTGLNVISWSKANG